MMMKVRTGVGVLSFQIRADGLLKTGFHVWRRRERRKVCLGKEDPLWGSLEEAANPDPDIVVNGE